MTPIAAAGPTPSLRPRPHACSPVGQRLDKDKDRTGEGVRSRTRPRPRRAPSEDQDDEQEREREGGEESAGRASGCGSEWLAGGGSGREQGWDEEPGLGAGPSRGERGEHAHETSHAHEQDMPLYVVCL